MSIIPGFLFLPAQNYSAGCYWPSTYTEFDIDYAYCFLFGSNGRHGVDFDSRTKEYAVRPFQN